MWKRKALKKKTCAIMKQTYWRMTAVCFLAAMLAGIYPVSVTFLGSQASIPSVERNMTAPFSAVITNSDLLSDLSRRLFGGTFISDFFRSPFSALADALIELGTTSSSVFFSFLRTVNNFFIENLDISTLLLAAGVVVSLLYQIFISNILNCCHFFTCFRMASAVGCRNQSNLLYYKEKKTENQRALFVWMGMTCEVSENFEKWKVKLNKKRTKKLYKLYKV